MARALIEAGAPVEGEPGERETPLITAASYGDAAVARVLIEAGADVTAHAAPDAGGVPGGSALLHAAVFGMTEVVDVLVEAGARPENIAEAAAAGDLRDFLTPDTPLQDRLLALIMAADHERLERDRRAAGRRHADRCGRRALGPPGAAGRRRQRPRRERRAPARPRRRPERPRRAARPDGARVVPAARAAASPTRAATTASRRCWRL